jgi:hypothetical protein
MPGGTLAPCGPCKDTRKAHDRWLAEQDIETKARMQREGRELLEQRQADADVAAMAVVNCGLCDDEGYRGPVVCDHVDRTETSARGMAAVRAAIERGGA